MPYAPIEDLTGRVFGKWTVLSYAGRGTRNTRHSRWHVRCECGTTTVASRNNLLNGATRSCGCAKPKGTYKGTHGYNGTSIYNIWVGIKQRCLNPNSRAFRLYGGRGIRVCLAFQSFESFLTVVGERPPGRSLDRINNDGHYSCGRCTQCVECEWEFNVRWATSKEQHRNCRQNRILEFDGLELPVAAWAERLNVNAPMLYARLKKGWSVEKTLTTPPLTNSI